MALSVLAALPAVSGSWILDDAPLIATNAKVHSFTWSNVHFLLTHGMWDLDASHTQLEQPLVYYRPLVMLSYLVDWVVGGGSSVSFHVANILLHALTILLAGRALLRWSGSEPGAVLGAAYFGLHPARAESVAWISGRPDVLATLGLLLCAEGVSTAGARRTPGIALFLGGAVVAFGSKETALLLPLLVAIELGTTRGPFSLGADWRKAKPLAAALLITACYAAARQLWLPMRPFPVTGLSTSTHLGFVLETLGRAVMFLVAPFDLSLSGATLTERAGHVAPHPGYSKLGLVTAVVVLGALVATRRRRSRAFWALLAFVVSLVPTLNIVWIGGIELTSARFFYLPGLLLAWVAIELGKGRFAEVSPFIKGAVGVGGGVTLALLLALQSTTFRSEDLYWTAELRSRPDDITNLGYLVNQDWQRGAPERAIARSLCRYRLAQERFSFRGEGADIIASVLEPWAKHLPDAATTELTAIADFLEAVRRPEGAAKLELQLSLQVPAHSKIRKLLQQKSALLQTQEAEIRVRLGERHRALELVRAARANCPRCTDLLPAQSFIAYRAFDPDFAEALAQGTPDTPWGAQSRSDALTRLRAENLAISQANGTAQLKLEVQRAAQLGLAGEALRLLQRARSEEGDTVERSLDEATLTFAALAGSRDVAERIATTLKVGVPPLPPRPSLGEAQQLLSQLHDGCVFPGELD
jgi:hypothetical protein